MKRNLIVVSVLSLSMFVSGCKIQVEQPQGAAGQAFRPIPDVLSSGGTFQTFRAALQMTGIDTQLRGREPYTVLVPNETAWANLPPTQLRDLFKADNTQQLRILVLNHIIPGSLSASDLASSSFVQTSNNVTYPVSRQGTSLSIGPARIIEPDIPADNGYINVIDTVLMPPPAASVSPAPASPAR